LTAEPVEARQALGKWRAIAGLSGVRSIHQRAVPVPSAQLNGRKADMVDMHGLGLWDKTAQCNPHQPLADPGRETHHFQLSTAA